MSREWQQTRMRKYVMPDAVYHQSLWAVRDLYRMERRIEELEEDAEFPSQIDSSRVCDQCEGIETYDSDTSVSMERELLKDRTGKIHAALETIPVMYRFYVLQNIIFREAGKTYPEEWRTWKQKFLFQVAKNLNMI